MKKGILLLSTILGLSQLTNAQKLALYEEFSGENCGPCAALNPALMTLLYAAGNESKVLLVKYQSPIPTAGPIYNQYTGDVQNRMTYNSVNFAPLGLINGTKVGPVGQNQGNISLTTQAMIDAAALEVTPFSLSIGTPTYTGNDFSVVVTLTANTASTLSNVKLRFALLEDMEYSMAPGTNGEIEFHNVLRRMYPNPNGTDVPVTFTAGQSQTFTITGTLPSYSSAENKRKFVAWVQNDGNKEVLQSAKSGALPQLANGIGSTSISIGNNKVQCGASVNLNPVVTIKNTGTANLTNATIYYKVNDGAYQSYQWTGGNVAPGATHNVSLPAITVNTPGQHIIRDSVAMPNGTPDNFIGNNVNATDFYLLNSTDEALPLSNDFEAVNNLWVPIAGTSGNPMFRASGSGVGYNGSNWVIYFPAYQIQDGDGYYVLPKANMAAGPKALDFQVAHAQYNAASDDKLEVVYSTDCGVTWTSIWSKSGTNLKTVTAPQTSQFIPNSNAQWRGESVDVTNVPQGARLGFRATSDYGNNIFVDNVTLRSGPVSITNVVAQNGVSLFPSPVQNTLNVELNIIKSTDITLSVINTLGQEVIAGTAKNFNTGKQTTTVNVASLAAGTYILQLKTTEGTSQHKFVKQ